MRSFRVCLTRSVIVRDRLGLRMTYHLDAVIHSDEPKWRTPEQEAAWQVERKVVLARDRYRCLQCSASGTHEEPLHVHHLVPRSSAGPDEAANLITLCPTCHAARHTNMIGSLARRTLERRSLKLARLLNPSVVGDLRMLGPAMRHLGVDRLRDGQMEIVTAAMRGESLLAVLPTGFGKSLCFWLPSLLMKGHSIVVTPTKPLMADQVAALFRNAVPALFINSDLSPPEKAIRYQLLEAGALKLLYVAPERFNPTVIHDPAEIKKLLVRRPAFLVVDEAHCIDRWGDSFRPDYARLGEIRAALGNPPVLAFTATAGKVTQERILDSLGILGRS